MFLRRLDRSGLLLWPAASSAQVVEYHHLDALGSIRAVTKEAGEVIERHDYLPFGEGAPPAPAPPTRALERGSSRSSRKERDLETGLDYFGARNYASNIARFTTVDPVYPWRENLLDPQRWNRYAFARNNPLRHVDPDGRVIFDFQEFKANLQLAAQFGANKAGFLVPESGCSSGRGKHSR